MQYVHDVRATDARRIVQSCVFKTAPLQLADALCGEEFHLLFGAKMNRTGRTGFHAGRFLTYADAVDAQRAFVGTVILFVDTRNVERATGDAVTAADAVFRLKIDDAVGVLQDRAFRRAGFQTARIGAVHTAVFADKPLQLAVLLNFRETHHGPGFRCEIHRVVVHAGIDADLVAQVVPFGTGNLTAFTADAGGDVDKLRHFLLMIAGTRRWREPVSCGLTKYVLRLHCYNSPPLDLFHVNQERLKFRRLRVSVTDRRRQRIGQIAFARCAFKAPVTRNANGFDVFPVDGQRTNTFGHHGFRHDETSLGRHFHVVTLRDTF